MADGDQQGYKLVKLRAERTDKEFRIYLLHHMSISDVYGIQDYRVTAYETDIISRAACPRNSGAELVYVVDGCHYVTTVKQ